MQHPATLVLLAAHDVYSTIILLLRHRLQPCRRPPWALPAAAQPTCPVIACASKAPTADHVLSSAARAGAPLLCLGTRLLHHTQPLLPTLPAGLPLAELGSRHPLITAALSQPQAGAQLASCCCDALAAAAGTGEWQVSVAQPCSSAGTLVPQPPSASASSASPAAAARLLPPLHLLHPQQGRPATMLVDILSPHADISLAPACLPRSCCGQPACPS